MDVIGFVRKKMILVVPAAVIAVVIGVYFVLFAPLMQELRAKYLECRSRENDVLGTRNIIDSAGKIYSDRVLMTEKDVPYAIDELTRHGMLKGINFISMIPQKVVTKTVQGVRYKVLPVEIELESTYEQLGIVLGSLDDLEKALVKIQSFDVRPDEADPSKFITDLLVYIYLSARKAPE